MPDRSSKKKPTDLNSLAAAIVGEATSDVMNDSFQAVKADTTAPKDPAAVALGRRGGLKGGKARAAALSPEERKRIAQGAARKRWGDKKPNS